jgi:hypothetical protein
MTIKTDPALSAMMSLQATLIRLLHRATADGDDVMVTTYAFSVDRLGLEISAYLAGSNSRL